MTIQGARDELLTMMECNSLPVYFVPILKKVAETIEMEFNTAYNIEQIRADIQSNFENSTDPNNIDAMMRNIGREECLEIIDKYTKGA